MLFLPILSFIILIYSFNHVMNKSLNIQVTSGQYNLLWLLLAENGEKIVADNPLDMDMQTLDNLFDAVCEADYVQ